MMNTNVRLHGCLDGEWPREGLPGEERDDLEVMERDLARIALSIRSIPAVDLRRRVLDSLPEAATPPSRYDAARTSLRQAWTWLWSPLQVAFEFRPSAALAMLLVVSLLPLEIFPGAEQGESPITADAGAAPQSVLVQFRLDAPDASSVSLAGTFSEWSPTIEMRESGPGVWTATVRLPAGVHDYLFLVDAAEWVPDPSARPIDDGFGGVNSRLFLTASSALL